MSMMIVLGSFVVFAKDTCGATLSANPCDSVPLIMIASTSFTIIHSLRFKTRHTQQ